MKSSKVYSTSVSRGMVLVTPPAIYHPQKTVLAVKMKYNQTLDISNTDISNYSMKPENI